MADIYTPPPDSSYLLVRPFPMPSDRGDRWAVAFTGRSAALVAAALSVVVTVSFLILWKLITFVAVLATRKHTRHRYVAVVTLWNSNDPWFAFKELLHYTYRHLQTAYSQKVQKPHNSSRSQQDTQSSQDKPSSGQGTPSGMWNSDFWYSFVFCLLALAVFVGGIVMGIVVPSLIQIGNVAPVRPSTVFYPATPLDNAQRLRDYGLRAPAAMRALGSVEAAEVTLRKKVSVESDDSESLEGVPAGERNVTLDYGYSLSGVDMGIAGGSDLEMTVDGHCVTDYTWISEPSSEDQDPDAADIYEFWNNPHWRFLVLLNANDAAHAPAASFFIHPSDAAQLSEGSDVMYAVLVHSAWRSSITESGDPWYATELGRTRPGPAPFNAVFRMKRRRPVLSCREKTSWTYAGKPVPSVFYLSSTPGMKIPEVLLDILETTLGSGPMLVRLGNASGKSALRSQTTSPNGVIDASESSMEADMTRLVLASYAATRNIFTDAVMFGSPSYGNVARGPDGQPREGAGNFVVSTPNIQTFSLTGIVTLLVILAALILVDFLAWGLIRFHHRHNPGAAADSESSTSRKSNLATKDGAVITETSSPAPETSGTAASSSEAVQTAEPVRTVPRKHTWTRFHVLSAIQLFRTAYEPGNGPREEWSCDTGDRTHYANHEEEFDMTTCNKSRCMGHIIKP